MYERDNLLKILVSNHWVYVAKYTLVRHLLAISEPYHRYPTLEKKLSVCVCVCPSVRPHFYRAFIRSSVRHVFDSPAYANLLLYYIVVKY